MVIALIGSIGVVPNNIDYRLVIAGFTFLAAGIMLVPWNIGSPVLQRQCISLGGSSVRFEAVLLLTEQLLVQTAR